MPQGIDNLLMYIQRTVNTNTIIYQLNADENGRPYPNEPIKISWIRYAEKGERKPLSFIQRRYAYGIKVRLEDAVTQSYSFTFNAYRKRTFELKRSNADKQYHVFSTINNLPAIITHVYVHVAGGTLMFPVIKYVQISGHSADNDIPVVETLTP